MRGKFIWDRKRMTWVPIARYRPQHVAGSLYVIGDTLPDLVHPANGKRYDSKSRFRAETKARGLVEFGTETQKRVETPMSPLKPAIKTAIEQLRAGYRAPNLDREDFPISVR